MKQREGYKKTEIGWIPVEWDVVSFGEILDYEQPTKYLVKTENYDDSYPIPVLTAGKSFILGYTNETDGVFRNLPAIIFDDFTTDSKYVDFPFKAKSSAMKILKVKDNEYPTKLFYEYLNSVHFIASTHKRYWISEYQKLKTPLPPLPEQKKIADILTTVDDKISSIDSQIQQTEQLKKGLMEKLLTEGIGHTEFKETEIGRIPIGWDVKTFQSLLDTGDILGIQDGNHGEIHPKTSDFVNDGIPFIMANCIINNKLRITNSHKISEKQYRSLRIGFSYPGDVLLTHKGSVGMTAIVYPEHGNIMLTPQVTYYRMSDNAKILNHFLHYYFQSPYYQKILLSFSKQSTRAYLGISAQKKLYCVLPPFQEQKQIATIISTVDNKLDILNQKKSQYQTLKKGLSQQLLTGQMRVKV